MIAGVLGMGRRMAASRMTDSCKITRVGSKTLNEGTGTYTPSVVTVFTGVCRIKSGSGVSQGDAGSELVVVSQVELHLPVTASGVLPGDTVEITGSLTRADQVGRVFQVVAAFDGSQTTALRYRVEVADGR